MSRPVSSERARRLAARRRAKNALEELRRLVRVLAEWERLEDADAIGVVRIEAGEAEAQYGADVLDLVGQAVREAGEKRVVEVFVTSSTDTNHRPQDGHRRQSWKDRTEGEVGSTRPPERRSASRAR